MPRLPIVVTFAENLSQTLPDGDAICIAITGALEKLGKPERVFIRLSNGVNIENCWERIAIKS